MESSPPSSAHELPLRSSDQEEDSDRSEPSSGAGAPVPPGGSSGARYKLMSPAKLPISRSSGISIPPGLSPTSFLESPVLLSNVKAEASPTTGSLNMHRLLGSSSNLTAKSFSNPKIFAERKPTYFEFKPHSRSNLVPAEMNDQRSEQSAQTLGQCKSQFFGPVSLTKSDLPVSSNDLTLSSPAQEVASGAGGPTDVESNDLNRTEQTDRGIQAVQSDHKVSGPSITSEGLSDDGYNWRKYGQKHVKGSEFPRSYYKCTHPNCEVKKLFERSPDGRITEIIYKGTHDHPKPPPGRRFGASTGVPIQEERFDRFSSVNDLEKATNSSGQTCNGTEPNGTPDLCPVAEIRNCVEGAEMQPDRVHDEVDDDAEDDSLSKRRRMEAGGEDFTAVVKPIREPRVVVQTISEVDILDDGYRWRKYGQKVVRGNPNPRSYYKCTNAGCPVRKHVERASHDPKSVITTYEGKHNHDVPAARASSHDTAGPSTLSRPSASRPEGDAISLDLGVGRSSAAGQQQILCSELVEGQIQPNSSNFKVGQSAPLSALHGFLNGNVNHYGSRENLSEDQTIELQVPSLTRVHRTWE
ncbi:probable WRKY transcription factor 20 isoform X1 [Punica granatum]|uniref:Uncharacterized protein n=3 Tax=Punica granatum TaxID=22663 RepID=A0A2I0L9W1_PUNGR|nr:probable WRKY transcription factor 20 isoform X1 [Punica granatum]PKI77478.1 hypothetical protein CRG98_002084 [Punica granatum]